MKGCAHLMPNPGSPSGRAVLPTLTSQGFLHPPQLHRRPVRRELDVVQIRCNNRTRRKPQLNALICRAGSSCCPQLGFGPFGGKAQRGPFWGWGHFTLHPKKKRFCGSLLTQRLVQLRHLGVVPARCLGLVAGRREGNLASGWGIPSSRVPAVGQARAPSVRGSTLT